jgi:hypothetical protein
MGFRPRAASPSAGSSLHSVPLRSFLCWTAPRYSPSSFLSLALGLVASFPALLNVGPQLASAIMPGTNGGAAPIIGGPTTPEDL